MVPAEVVLVTGAGGFIGGHLVRSLVRDGVSVVATDVKPLAEWFQAHPEAVNLDGLDLNAVPNCRNVARRCTQVYHLAADMGGMGFIESNKAACMLNVLNSTHMLMAASDAGVRRYLYASTACVYSHAAQTEAVPARGLREDDVYPADPEDGYGWEKLFSERMARHFREDFGLETRVARLHTVYGPDETWRGGREKVPAALCRKIAVARRTGAPGIEVWGDGEQGRSFLHVDDCVRGLRLLMESECHEPVNIGSPELVSVNDLARLLMDIAGYSCRLEHIPGPLGVRGRFADISLARRELGWSPRVRLEDGMRDTFWWIDGQVGKAWMT